MIILEKFNPQQLVPVDAKENKVVPLKFSDGSTRNVPVFVLVAVLKEGSDIAYAMWNHVNHLFYINWIRRNKINTKSFQYVESLEDDEFVDALKLCRDERVIVVRKEDMLWTDGNTHGMDPTTLTYDLHPSMFNLAEQDTKNLYYHSRGKPVHGWKI